MFSGRRGLTKRTAPTRKHGEFGDYNLADFDAAALKAHHLLRRFTPIGIDGHCKVVSRSCRSAATLGHFADFGRNISFGQNLFNSVSCIHLAKLIPLHGKP